MRWRVAAAVLVASACGHSESDPKDPPKRAAVIDAVVPDAAPAADGLPAHHRAASVGDAVKEIIAHDHPRVIGFGELHARTDRAQVTSSLARFTRDVLPAIQDQLSDLVLETWIPDPSCAGAKETSAHVETVMRRPAAVHDEVTALALAARAAKVQPRAMRLSCDDYAKVAPKGKDPDIEAMLDIVTRELGKGATDAVAARDKDPAARPLVATYGGALHNDLYPNAGTESWSFAKRVDDATGGRYAEVDLYVPELAADDKVSKSEPWFPLLADAGPDHVVVIERGARSWIILLPTSR